MAELTHAQRVNSNSLAMEYFDSLMIRYHYIDNVEPDTSCSVLGMDFKTPILSAGFGMHKRIHESGSLGFAKAIDAAGTFNLNGWMKDEEMEEIAKAGIRTARTIKPFRDHDEVYRCLEHDAACGASAAAMDIDHIFDGKGKYVDMPSGKCGRQTVEDLKGYKQAAKIPFIMKGILTAEDAEKCVEIGVDAIIVSNHNNRFPCMVPPLAALPEIQKVVNGAFPILVDGCIESGVEAFKALALGADAVLTCRPLMAAFAKGPEAVTEALEKMREELACCMANTGSATVGEISYTSLMKKFW